MRRIEVVDTHTGGEPTRVVVAGGPDLGTGPMAERRARFRDEQDRFRSAVVNEPRGSNVLVGALLCEPVDAANAAGVVFFNDVGVLNMCGHGTIGVAVALAHLGRIGAGAHRLETSAGVVGFELHPDLRHVTIENVPAYRHRAAVTVEVEGYGRVAGDVAWGGNWFFLVSEQGPALELARVEALLAFTKAIRAALRREGVTGEDGAEIDHIELIGHAREADGRGFVLCPGAEWDRSPCGTGTSAKVACLAADGRLAPGETWRQESVLGSVFEARYRLDEKGSVIPSITGSAWVTGEATLLIDERDPFAWGIRP